MAETIGVNLPTVATPPLLKKVMTLGVWMQYPEDLTSGIQPFVLGQHTAPQRESVLTTAE